MLPEFQKRKPMSELDIVDIDSLDENYLGKPMKKFSAPAKATSNHSADDRASNGFGNYRMQVSKSQENCSDGPILERKGTATFGQGSNK